MKKSYKICADKKYEFDIGKGMYYALFVNHKDKTYFKGSVGFWDEKGKWMFVVYENGEVETFTVRKDKISFKCNKKFYKKMTEAGYIQPWDFIQVFDEMNDDDFLPVPEPTSDEDVKKNYLVFEQF